MRAKVPNNDIVNGHASGEQEPELEPVLDIKTSVPRGSQRPASMYETREGLRKSAPWTTNICQVEENLPIKSHSRFFCGFEATK